MFWDPNVTKLHGFKKRPLGQISNELRNLPVDRESAHQSLKGKVANQHDKKIRYTPALVNERGDRPWNDGAKQDADVQLRDRALNIHFEFHK